MIEEPSTFNEAAIIARLRDGDEAAFNELYREYHPVITRQLWRILKNDLDVEEIVNDTFAICFRKIRGFRGNSTLKTWLICIAKNKAFNRLGFNRRRGAWLSDSLNKPLDDDGFTLGDTLSDSDHRPAIELGELEINIEVAMQQIDEVHREALMLRAVKHLSYEEISACLGINIGTVKSRIARARASLLALISATQMQQPTRI